VTFLDTAAARMANGSSKNGHSNLPAEPVALSGADIDTTGGFPLISDKRWSDLAKFCLLRDEDFALLADAAPLAELADIVATSFYDHILAHAELKAVIERNSSIDRLRATLARYFKSLFSGRLDDDRVEGIVKVGVVHDRIELPLNAYLGAGLRIDRVVIPALINRYGSEPETLAKAIMAYRKLFTFDVATVTETFIHSREGTTNLVIDNLEPTIRNEPGFRDPRRSRRGVARFRGGDERSRPPDGGAGRKRRRARVPVGQGGR
jgi:hypothetical protein